LSDAPDDLDRVLGALANHHRREIVRMLAFHPHSISQLAHQRGLSLPAINKHIAVLERAGLVARRKTGRTTFLALGRKPILELQAWLGEFHAYWGSEAESLANYDAYLASDPGPTREKA
jgi:DNA-binding transcriptional ArsR family regulator